MITEPLSSLSALCDTAGAVVRYTFLQRIAGGRGVDRQRQTDTEIENRQIRERREEGEEET